MKPVRPEHLVGTLPSSLSGPIERVLGKGLQRWALPWARHAARGLIRGAASGLSTRRLRHVLFCFCDHYEPEWGRVAPAVAEARVAFWQARYPAFQRFRDADGRPPQHSFFFPGEEYRPAYLDRLTELVQRGLGEVELHLHHDADTAEVLERRIETYLAQLAAHGHLSRPEPGTPLDRDARPGAPRLRYGFIHGNWALANAYGTGKHCGVDDELQVLHRTGCYADFTFPSAPHPTQPRVVNQIYWPADLPGAAGYNQGEPARVGGRQRDRVLMVQGPLALSRRPGSLRPRIESAAVTAADPATPARLRTWAAQDIGVAGRPDWVFVKVHTHGAPEAQAASLLGPPGEAMHEALATGYNDGVRWALHYVTARELYNIACAAMDGYDGDPGSFRDYCLPPPPARPQPAVPLRPPAPADLTSPPGPPAAFPLSP